MNFGCFGDDVGMIRGYLFKQQQQEEGLECEQLVTRALCTYGRGICGNGGKIWLVV